jgi:nucleoid-associated protein YejK
MPEEQEPSEHIASEAVQQLAQQAYQWLYHQLAEGEQVDVQTLRQKLETDKSLSLDEITEAYHLAMQMNENHRADLPKSASQESYEKQTGLHEDINFMLTDAETSLYEEQRII